MDTGTIDKKGFSPLKPAWAKIAEIKDANQLPALLGWLDNNGVPVGFFDFGVAQDEKDSSKQIAQIFQGGLSLPDRDYYIVDSARFKTTFIRSPTSTSWRRHSIGTPISSRPESVTSTR